jgi:ABC-type sugar transport system ATPase subunit
MARVKLEGVSKVYAGGVRGVESIELLVEDGELVVLVGPTGSGKTTILRLVAGLERATTGKILVGDREVTNVSPRERDVAYVPQSCPLYPHLSVFDNLIFSGRVRHVLMLTRWWRHVVQPHKAVAGLSRAEQSTRVRQAAEKLGIGHLLERWPRQLSGGERQRVALGRALVREPAAFLFDEPLSSLDSALRSQLRTEIKQWQRQAGRAMLYVTHDQSEALALADRMVVLDGGKVQQVAAPDVILDRPANRFVGRFIGGSPPMNLLPGRVEQRDRQWWFVSHDWRLPLTDAVSAKLVGHASGVELGLRSEAIELIEASAADDAPQARVARSVRQGAVREIVLRPAKEEKRDSIAVERLMTSATGDWHVGNLVSWRPRWPQAHWFDRESGQRIDVATTAAHEPTI